LLDTWAYESGGFVEARRTLRVQRRSRKGTGARRK